jgi:hypothetical protein
MVRRACRAAKLRKASIRSRPTLRMPGMTEEDYGKLVMQSMQMGGRHMWPTPRLSHVGTSVTTTTLLAPVRTWVTPA